MPRQHLLWMLLLLSVSLSPHAEAQTVIVELNKLESRADACRAYLVIENSEHEFTEFKLDLVMFDTTGVVAKRLLVDISPLRASKTSVKLFDVAGLVCSDIDRVLINDVSVCRDLEKERSDCVNLIEVRHITKTALIK